MIEFVPKSDPQVQQLLQLRGDVFPDYTREQFERAFGSIFRFHAPVPVPGTERLLYTMEKRP